MKKQVAALVGAAILFTVLAGALYRGYDQFVALERAADGHAGMDGTGLPRQTQEVLPSDSSVAAMQRFLEERDQVVQAVIDGKITLVKAAARFRAINASRPPGLAVHLDLYAGQTDEERICRQVITYVESKLAGRPEASAILARLESELQDHLAADGAIQVRNRPAQAPRRSAE
jgi:hypothetical protein